MRILFGEGQQTKDEQSDIQTIARKIGALNILIGMLGFVDPVVKGNDDQGVITMKPGLFLGVIATNPRHDLHRG